MQADSFYTNPRLTALFMLFIVVLGSVSFAGLARQEDPTMTERYAQVNTFLPGASAARMESLVSEPLETSLREIPEIKEIESTSKSGISVISIELLDRISPEDTQNVWSEVRDQLGAMQATFPRGTVAPDLRIVQPVASTIIIALSWRHSSDIEMSILSRLAESLRLQLANMSGTEKAESWGEAEEEIVVSLDPNRMVASGVSAAFIAQRIGAADTKIASGRLRAGGNDILVGVDAELDSVERIASIPLVMANNGSTLRVSDIATVRKTQLDPPRSLAFHGTEQVIFVNAKMQGGLQIENWTRNANALVAKFEANLPNSIGLETVYSQNIYTDQRMNSLANNLIFALVIVLLVLIWLMGIRSALTVGIALPLSASMVLVGMQVLDIPLHQMSVTGLIISLGLLIDNAIVVVEDYKLRRSRGAQIDEAISRAIKHLLVPLGASTATTIFAFMPIAMAPGGVGDFTGTLGVTVALSVASSFILAMTVVPAIAGYLENRWPAKAGNHWWQTGFSSPALTKKYHAALVTVLKRPIIGVTIACIMPLIGFLLAPTLTQQFFPSVDRNQFQVQLSLPAQTSIWETQQAIVKADEILRSNSEVTDTFWTIGKGAPRVYYNVISLNERIPSFAAAWVNTTSAEATGEILGAIQSELSVAFPSAEVLALPFEQGPPTDSPIEIRIIGQDLDVLRQEALKLRAILASVRNVTYARASLSTAEPKLTFIPRENALAATGLSTGGLAQRINSALMGDSAGTVLEGNTEIDVRVKFQTDSRNQMSDLNSLPILANGRDGIPLSELGDWQLVPTASSITRRQGERISAVRGYLIPFTLAGGVLADFTEKLEQQNYKPPPGYRLQLGGEAESSSESIGGIVQVFIFFLLAMAGIIILSLNSFRYAGLIGIVAFLSFGLALLGVRIFGYPFGYMALIGSLGMMGLAINGAIIVLSALKADPRSQSGDSEGIASVVVDSTRHIISTTLTTIGGFVPLIVNGGEFWPPLATAIAGGVVGSAVIALSMVPSVFAYIQRKKVRKAVVLQVA